MWGIFARPCPFEVVGWFIVAELETLHVSGLWMWSIVTKEYCAVFLWQSTLMRIKHSLRTLKGSHGRWRFWSRRELVDLAVSRFVHKGACYRILQLIWIIGQIGPRRHHTWEQIIVLNFVMNVIIQIHLRSALLNCALGSNVSLLSPRLIRRIQKQHVWLSTTRSIFLIRRVPCSSCATLTYKFSMKCL